MWQHVRSPNTHRPVSDNNMAQRSTAEYQTTAPVLAVAWLTAGRQTLLLQNPTSRHIISGTRLLQVAELRICPESRSPSLKHAACLCTHLRAGEPLYV